jgi:hypothetical protein
MSTPVYTADVVINAPANQSIEQMLVGPYGDTGTSAAPFVHESNTLLSTDESTVSLRPHQMIIRDVDPERAGTNRFGDEVIFRFGQEFPGANVGQEVHIRLPRLTRSATAGTTFTTSNGNPLDTGYVAAGGAATDFLQWRPNIGELCVFGGLSNYLEQKHGPTEILSRIRAWQIQLKRRLCDDDIKSAFRTAYLNAIGGERQLNTNAAIDVFVRIPAPWAPDQGECYERPLAQQAYAEQFELRIPLPPLDELLEAQLTTTAGTVLDPINLALSPSVANHLPRLSLRNQFYNTPSDEKKALAQMVINKGMTFKVQRVTQEREYEFDANSVSDVQVAIDIEAAKLPVAYLIATINFKDDLRKTNEVASFAHGETDLSKKRTVTLAAGTFLVRPNPKNLIVPKRWWIQDQSERVVHEHDMHSWLNSHLGGYTSRFPSTPFEKCAVICPSHKPAAEKDTHGFIDFTAMQKPRFHLVIPPNPATDANQKRVVRLLYVYENAIEQKDGQMHMSIFHAQA